LACYTLMLNKLISIVLRTTIRTLKFNVINKDLPLNVVLFFKFWLNPHLFYVRDLVPVGVFRLRTWSQIAVAVSFCEDFFLLSWGKLLELFSLNGNFTPLDKLHTFIEKDGRCSGKERGELYAARIFRTFIAWLSSPVESLYRCPITSKLKSSTGHWLVAVAGTAGKEREERRESETAGGEIKM